MSSVKVVASPAGSVVVRYLAYSDEVAHRFEHVKEPVESFMVDGQPFPYVLTSKGPKFIQLIDDLWRVDVEIIGGLLADDTGVHARRPDGKHEIIEESFTDGYAPVQPVISGVTFPWSLTGDGVEYRHSHKTLPIITLGFLARNVDTGGGAFEDQRAAQRTVVDNMGSLWHENPNETALRDKLNRLTADWPIGEYDMKNGTWLRRGASYEDHYNEDGDLVAITVTHPDTCRQVRITLDGE